MRRNLCLFTLAVESCRKNKAQGYFGRRYEDNKQDLEYKLYFFEDAQKHLHSVTTVTRFIRNDLSHEARSLVPLSNVTSPK